MGSQKILHCISNKAFHILNCAFLIFVLIFQSFVLNTYIISYTWNWDVASYFWFLGDLMLAGLFVAMSTRAYSYLSEQKLLKKNEEKLVQSQVSHLLKPQSLILNQNLFIFLGSRSFRKECPWSTSSLLCIMDLLCHLPSHQSSLHI